jgi:uncharacterized DUF497 family protein
MNALFEWDPNKNESNKAKHGLSFETAVLVFQDPNLLSILDERYQGEEERWVSIGLIDIMVVYVAHTVSEDDNGEETIRIISARKATPREERRYFDK